MENYMGASPSTHCEVVQSFCPSISPKPTKFSFPFNRWRVRSVGRSANGSAPTDSRDQSGARFPTTSSKPSESPSATRSSAESWTSSPESCLTEYVDGRKRDALYEYVFDDESGG